MLTGNDVLKSFTFGINRQRTTLNLSSAIWQAVLEVSASHPEIFNAIYLEATA